eukprot:1161215-Pelagomonas_calceolata.AAC.18
MLDPLHPTLSVLVLQMGFKSSNAADRLKGKLQDWASTGVQGGWHECLAACALSKGNWQKFLGTCTAAVPFSSCVHPFQENGISAWTWSSREHGQASSPLFMASTSLRAVRSSWTRKRVFWTCACKKGSKCAQQILPVSGACKHAAMKTEGA